MRFEPLYGGGGIVDIIHTIIPTKSQINVNNYFRLDYYHNMLMAGEVEEVVVYPGAKAALVFLRTDAVYKVRSLSL